ncbi:UbiD family decarboxylase domain-containing protein [Pseudofrancisella aestuarii]|uniref:UbiD family decarboxylase domain-containing protein n=1 Tax=Pseudofrancisella aestuarii TaxID=2670347 RepID=A0ABV9TDH5_9GAMM|nr:UbiD family decarboxylase [Pseudofrancisella aestuarii]
MSKQQSLSSFIQSLEKSNLLIRIKEPKRVDQIPQIMEQNPTKAIFIEKIIDSEFSVLTNAYSNHEMYAQAMECDKTEVPIKLTEKSKGRIKPIIVDDAPCKQVILKGEDVDLTKLPHFLHHDRDGHAYTNDNLFISKDPNTGIYDWGIYRSMFRTKNEKSVDMTCTSHRQRLNAMAAAAKGQNLEVAIVIGGPTLDKLAALSGVPVDTDDFEVLGSFYEAPAKLIKCETIDILVPANAEIVLECELMATEGLVYDEGPYGEFTGTYGGGLKQNYRLKVKAMTYVKNGIYQHVTIGGLRPWYSDNMLQLPAIEADIYNGLKAASIDVKEVRCPKGGLSNIAYAKISPRGAGDAKQALGIMLTCSKQSLPKIAMVFSENIDIWDDDAINSAMAFCYMPDRDTVIINGCNTMTVDPKSKPAGVASKIGLDCTIPYGPEWNHDEFEKSSLTNLGEPPKDIKTMTEEEITIDMEAFIREKPRAWYDILKHYHGQPYPNIYRAFGNLRNKLNRENQSPWYPYKFMD